MRHWLVVAVMVGHPVAGPVKVVVWWLSVAATGAMLCEVGQHRWGEAKGVVDLHGSPDGKDNGKRVHLGSTKRASSKALG